ncbi:class I SAM-dependent RNA methyltransferase [Litorivivens sp.]|uniref:class I SAM-dependent RNA methyltransferase n=1 Tax=Litorivivens sp. TaxID=2020868 RepID=UPI003563C333
MSRLRVYKKDKARPQQWQDELTITRLSDDGRGVAKRSGKVVFVERCLPGETVTARSYRTGKRFDDAELIAVTEPSSQRVEPPCRHYNDCGGCQLQHMGITTQREYKTERFAAMLSRLNGPEALPPIVGEAFGYRHRIRLAFEKGRVGLKAARSHAIVPVPECLILRPALAGAMKTLYRHSESFSALFRGEIELVEGQGGQVACALSLTKKPTAAALSRFLASFPLPVSLIVVGDEVLRLEAAELLYPDGDLRFEPSDFTQVNPDVNRQLLAQVGDWLALTQEDWLLDAFSGLGNFSLALAALCSRVLGLESDAEMVARARLSAPATVRFEQADLFEPKLSLPEGLNKAVIDPPRAGASALCEKLAAMPLRRIVYVSCDPATLERDAGILMAGGYRLESARWVDMFPQTHHMESVLLFKR